MLSQYNPTFSQGLYNPWEGQGDTIENSDEYSTDEEGPGGFWNWWGQNGEEATDIFNSVLCAIKPERCRQSGGDHPGGYPQKQDNTVVFILAGLVVLLLVVFLFKK